MGLFGHSVASTLARKRTCPSCRRVQIVPISKLRETVRCKHCGVDIPPKKK